MQTLKKGLALVEYQAPKSKKDILNDHYLIASKILFFRFLKNCLLFFQSSSVIVNTAHSLRLKCTLNRKLLI